MGAQQVLTQHQVVFVIPVPCWPAPWRIGAALQQLGEVVLADQVLQHRIERHAVENVLAAIERSATVGDQLGPEFVECIEVVGTTVATARRCTTIAPGPRPPSGSAPVDFFYRPRDRRERDADRRRQPLEGQHRSVRPGRPLHNQIDGRARAILRIAHVLDTEVHNALWRDRQILLQIAPEILRRHSVTRAAHRLAPTEQGGHPRMECCHRCIVHAAEIILAARCPTCWLCDRCGFLSRSDLRDLVHGLRVVDGLVQAPQRRLADRQHLGWRVGKPVGREREVLAASKHLDADVVGLVRRRLTLDDDVHALPAWRDLREAGTGSHDVGAPVRPCTIGFHLAIEVDADQAITRQEREPDA